MNRFQEVLNEWEQTISKNPDNPIYYSEQRGNYSLLLAYALRQLDQDEKAIQSYDLAIQKNPEIVSIIQEKRYFLIINLKRIFIKK
ncbi:unnamed protein product [Paramecium sonneborni]|uniref:Photosystem I assembly protein Ycf3 n=1 Tax=Paramecium sonneborni TaxID=65129 RepID=A0A8S1RM75_9CILI|nr:unnamed protein product [Paramecium sonneborni]